MADLYAAAQSSTEELIKHASSADDLMEHTASTNDLLAVGTAQREGHHTTDWMKEAPWSRAVAEAIREQPPDVAARLLKSIETHGLEFELRGDDRVVFKAGGEAFCAVTLETKVMVPGKGTH